MLYKIIPISTYHLMILSGVIAFLFPFVLQVLSRKLNDKVKNALLFLYLIAILCITLFTKTPLEHRKINLIPLWSYSRPGNSFTRYQSYMNIFLFIPFGFLLPYSYKRTFLQLLIIGCCLSIIIEAVQFIFAIGYCETDDVIHNTFGCIIGYWYWFGLNVLSEKLRRDKD